MNTGDGGVRIERGEGRDRTEPHRRVHGEQLHAQRVEIVGHAGQLAGAAWLLVLLGDQDLQRGAGERQRAGERLVEQGAHRIPVRGRSDLLEQPLLWSHVRGRTHHVALALGHAGHQAEVEQHDAARGGDEHVVRLDVAVDEPVRVQRGQPGGELGQRGAEPALVEAPAGSHVVQERGPFDQLHREPPLAALLDQLAERDEVGMMHILHGTELGLEPEQAIGADALQRLERHPHAAWAVERLVDHAHAAATQRAEDLEPAGELSPGDVCRQEVRGARRFAIAVACELDHERTAVRAGLDVLLGPRTGIAGEPTRDQLLDRVLREAPHDARYTILESRGLAGVLQEYVKNPGVRRHAAADLERRLHEILDACRTAWQGHSVPEHEFVRHLAENLSEDGDLIPACPGCTARIAVAELVVELLGQDAAHAVALDPRDPLVST
jgi:hypothetical protein